MSVVGSDYDKLKRYNISEIYSPTPRPQPKQIESKEPEQQKQQQQEQSKDSVEVGKPQESDGPEGAETAKPPADASEEAGTSGTDALT